MTLCNKVYVIAEAGVNHNGDMALAAEMVRAAAEAGADAVKFQTFRAAELVTPEAQQAEYQRRNTGIAESQYDMLQRLELTEKAHHDLIDLCNQSGVDFLSSVFSLESARFLIGPCKQSRIKLGSGELTNAPLLLEIARGGADVIISTGMATQDEIGDALAVLAFGYFAGPDAQASVAAFHAAYRQYKDQLPTRVSILQCTTNYPCSPGEANLAVIPALAAETGCVIGFSDHSEGYHLALAAIGLGARLVEKHYTLDRSLPGPDHAASLEPGELADMIRMVREVEQAIGDGNKQPSEAESRIRPQVRKGLVAATDIKKGAVFTEENLTTRRPEQGLAPVEYWNLLGKVADRDYNENDMIIGEIS